MLLQDERLVMGIHNVAYTKRQTISVHYTLVTSSEARTLQHAPQGPPSHPVARTHPFCRHCAYCKERLSLRCIRWVKVSSTSTAQQLEPAAVHGRRRSCTHRCSVLHLACRGCCISALASAWRTPSYDAETGRLAFFSSGVSAFHSCAISLTEFLNSMFLKSPLA